MRIIENKFDSLAFGQAVKEARESRGWTRERLAQEVNLVPRYIMSIENKGQHPSLQVLFDLATMFQISVDQYFFPDQAMSKSSRRLQIDGMLDTFSDQELLIIEATAQGIVQARSRK